MFIPKATQLFLHLFFPLYLNIGKISIPCPLRRRKRYCFIKTTLIGIHLRLAVAFVFSYRKRLNCCIPSFLPNYAIITFITILLDTDRIIIDLQIFITAIRIFPFQITLIFTCNFSNQSILLDLLERSYSDFNVIFKLIDYCLSFRLALELVLLVFFIVATPQTHVFITDHLGSLGLAVCRVSILKGVLGI